MKKKSEEHRQLAHESQLKENQVTIRFLFFPIFYYNSAAAAINQIENKLLLGINEKKSLFFFSLISTVCTCLFFQLKIKFVSFPHFVRLVLFLDIAQWLHALRRRDQENHRLHQQLLKFLHSKSTGGGGSTGMVQVEMRGSLGAPARTSLSDSTRLRKQWDRTATADDAKKSIFIFYDFSIISVFNSCYLYLVYIDWLKPSGKWP